MRLLSLLEDERIADASWSIVFRQSPCKSAGLEISEQWAQPTTIMPEVEAKENSFFAAINHYGLKVHSLED